MAVVHIHKEYGWVCVCANVISAVAGLGSYTIDDIKNVMACVIMIIDFIIASRRGI